MFKQLSVRILWSFNTLNSFGMILMTLSFRQYVHFFVAKSSGTVLSYEICGPDLTTWGNTGSSKKLEGILNRYNLKSTKRINTFGIFKVSETFKALDLP